MPAKKSISDGRRLGVFVPDNLDRVAQSGGIPLLSLG